LQRLASCIIIICYIYNIPLLLYLLYLLLNHYASCISICNTYIFTLYHYITLLPYYYTGTCLLHHHLLLLLLPPLLLLLHELLAVLPLLSLRPTHISQASPAHTAATLDHVGGGSGRQTALPLHASQASLHAVLHASHGGVGSVYLPLGQDLEQIQEFLPRAAKHLERLL
jgi:hypothetical protein